MKIIIVEDELASQQYLKQLLMERFPQLKVVAIAESVPDALQAIQEHRPDIVFLDVEIKMGNGFDVLAQVPDRSFEVVFTTAYNAFAVEAFRHHAVDYLLKPLNAAYVAEATERCLQRLKEHKSSKEQVGKLLQQVQQPIAQKSKLSIHTMDGIEFIEVQDIVYGEANGNYTDLWLKTGSKVTTSRRLKEMEESLPGDLFFRVHHSYIVNLQYVRKYHKGRGGYLVLHNGNSLPVSSARKDDFLNWLG